MLTQHKPLISARSTQWALHWFAHWQLPILVHNVPSEQKPLYLWTLPSVCKRKVTSRESTHADDQRTVGSESAHTGSLTDLCGPRCKASSHSAFTTSWLASWRQPCSLVTRCVRTVFLTPGKFPFLWGSYNKCVRLKSPQFSWLRGGENQNAQMTVTWKSPWPTVSQEVNPNPSPHLMSDTFGAFPMSTPR